jgi:hypothetical protein
MIPLFYKLIFLAFMEGFQTPLRNLDNGDVYDPLVLGQNYKRFTPYSKLFSAISKA